MSTTRDPEEPYFVGRGEWLQHCPLPEQIPEPQQLGFDELINKIGFFLAIKPQQFDALRHTFSESGVLLPLERIKGLVSYDRWRAFIWFKLLGKGAGFGQLVSALRSKPESLAAEAIEVRRSLERELAKLLDVDLAGQSMEGMVRRWHIQRVRYFANRLLYLNGPDGFRNLLSLLPDVEELDEIRALLRALTDDDLEAVLRRPGRVAGSYAELRHESTALLKLSDLILKNDDVVADSATSLILHGVVQDDRSSIERASPDKCFLIETILGRNSTSRLFSDLSYLDEIQTLLLGHSGEALQKIFLTRFSAKEDFALEGLKLGGDKYFSG